MFFIAELSANHNGQLKTALKLCEAAKEAGADAVKLQTYTPEGMSLKPELRKLYKKAMTPRDWHPEIFKRCGELDLVCFSSPFTVDDVDFLEDLGCPIYKVASFEIGDVPLIKHIASKGKPMIISAGMATEAEITDALRAAQLCDVILLKCTSAYPADPKEANLATLADMRHKWKHIRVGISDHTPGIGVAVAAVALGAEVVEKHFALDKKGIDAEVSLLPEEFAQMVTECKRAREAIGRVNYSPTSSEWKDYRRSLWVVKDISAGEKFTEDHVKSLRPAGGLEPKHLPNIIGQRAKQDMAKGEALTWDAL